MPYSFYTLSRGMKPGECVLLVPAGRKKRTLFSGHRAGVRAGPLLHPGPLSMDETSKFF